MQNYALAAQQESWRLVERFRGRYNLSLEDVLHLPDEPVVRAQLEWLRVVLRARGACRVLELGAGCGWAARALAADGHQVVATDILDDPQVGLGRAVRQRNHAGSEFACVLTSAESLPFRPDSFDCIFCFATLRHIVDLERVFQEISRVLRPGGLFVALQEPFRGSLTTQAQRFQDCFTYLLARWWLPGELPGNPRPELLQIRNALGWSLHEVCRRAAYCRAIGRAAGLQTTVLPTAVALSLQPDLKPSAENLGSSQWLHAFLTNYGLSADRLHAWLKQASRDPGVNLLPKLLAHWMSVGNTDGVILASKGEDAFETVVDELSLDPERCRRLDSLLLACAQNGFVPIYGFYGAEGDLERPYHWMQPEAGFLIPGAAGLELTLTCPPLPFAVGPVRFEIRLEAERQPHWVFVIVPGQTASARVPMAKAAERQPSILVRLTANFGFIPSDFHPGESQDSRLLSLQIRGVRTRRVADDEVRALLDEIHRERGSHQSRVSEPHLISAVLSRKNIFLAKL